MPKILKSLYIQVILAIIAGIALGYAYPKLGEDMKPLGDTFIRLVKMVVVPIIFCTVVSGIAAMRDAKQVGRVGGKAILYFEVATTLALVIGLVIVNLVGPGNGFHVDAKSLDPKAVASFTAAAQKAPSTLDFVLNIIPANVIEAFGKGDLLQVLFFSVLFGFALSRMGSSGHALQKVIDEVAHTMFGVVNIIMRVAPIGAFGAMAFTIGKYGVAALSNLAVLMICFYATCLLFVFGVLGVIARFAGFSVWKFIKYIREELLIVLGTSSSESALPRLIAKLERMGCQKSVVGLVVPTGYSFNLDGTSIYLTMAAVFIAQATDTPLSLGQQIGLLGVLLLTSKGAAGVTGSGFVTLAATLAVIDSVPVAGLALILGIDRFMSEARALTNLVGNGVATVVVSRWENALDVAQMNKVLNGDHAALESEIDQSLRPEELHRERTQPAL